MQLNGLCIYLQGLMLVIWCVNSHLNCAKWFQTEKWFIHYAWLWQM